MDLLRTEILQFYDDWKETEESKERRVELRRRIKDIVNEFISNADVVVVGSCGNGFGTKNGDLDLTVLTPTTVFSNYSANHILIRIERSLARDRSSYTDIEVLHYTCTFQIASCCSDMFTVVAETSHNF